MNINSFKLNKDKLQTFCLYNVYLEIIKNNNEIFTDDDIIFFSNVLIADYIDNTYNSNILLLLIIK